MPPIARAIGLRLLYGIPVLFIVTLGAAALSVFMPGSPAQAILGDQATADQVDALNHQFGWDKPILEQYGNWLWAALHGDLGVTVLGGEHVASLLVHRLAVTGEIALLALAMALLVAVPLALAAAYRRGGFLDHAAHTVSSMLLSVPSFVSVVLLALIFTAWLGMFPATGWVPLSENPWENLRYAFLPALALAVYEGAFFYRVLRTDLGATLREDFVLVARAKGLSRSYILRRHVLRLSLGALVTVFGLSLGRLLGGAVIAETFFAVPGLGAEAVNAVSQKDIGILQGIVALAVVVYVVVFILVDLAYAWIDPRISVR
jgi:peptide/nickel transport system permease protein